MNVIGDTIEEGGLKQEDILRLIRLQHDMNGFNSTLLNNNILNNQIGRSSNYFSNSNQNITNSEYDKERRDQLRKMMKQNQQIMMNFNSSIPFSQRRTNTNMFNQIIQNEQNQNSQQSQTNQSSSNQNPNQSNQGNSQVQQGNQNININLPSNKKK